MMAYVRYVTEPDDMQVGWGACADPRGRLGLGQVYKVQRVEQHSWHSKLFLVGVDCGRGFNSVSFQESDENM